MLTQADFEYMEARARAKEPGWQQAVITLVADRDSFNPREWMDWPTDSGTVLLAELAKNAQGHAYDGFWDFAFGDFWSTANSIERSKLLTCLVESLHILSNERRASSDMSYEVRFQNQAVKTVTRYLGVFHDSEVATALDDLEKKLKGHMKDVVERGSAEDHYRRQDAALQAFKDAPPAA